MSLTHALQHLLAVEIPRAFAGSPLFRRELRQRMRLAALRWRQAVELGEHETAAECLATAIGFREQETQCRQRAQNQFRRAPVPARAAAGAGVL